MTSLVVGATGSTGRLVVEQLLAQGEQVKIIVRTVDSLSDKLIRNKQLLITEASILDMTATDLLEHVQGCEAVISCLGHNLNFKGMFGQPRRLVTDTVKRLSHAIELSASPDPVKFVLMNTTGNQNLQAGEKISIAQRLTVGLIRVLLPPHLDNELAAAYLQSNFGRGQRLIEWCAIRPDSLINQKSLTEYDVYASPIRSAIFDAGKTSRINVAHFMTELVTNNSTWETWQGQMPVIYNK